MRRTLTAVLRAWAGQLENGVLGPEKESPEEAEPSSMVRRTATLGGGGGQDPTSVPLEDADVGSWRALCRGG